MNIKTIFFGVLAFAVLLIAGSSFYTVSQGDRAVITRNGAIIGISEPGLHWKVPIIDSAIDISVQTRALLYENEPVYSRDQQAADITFSVNYSVLPSEVANLYARYGSIEGIEGREITREARQEIKNIFGKFNAVTAIQERTRLGQEVTIAFAKIGEGLLKVESVQIENINFSTAYENSIEQRMLAEVEVQKLRQNAEREKVNAEITVTQAQAAADSQVAVAQAQAQATKLAGDATASAIRAKGKAEADTIKAKADALRENPGLVDLMKAERWDGVLPTSMIPGNAVPFVNIK